MAYVRETWKNREVERPRTFTKVENPDGTITLVPAEGNIIEPGTPIIAVKMNNIEVGIEEALDKADQAFQSASDGKTVIASSITAKGVPASKEDTFPTLAGKINQIVTDPSIGTTNAIASDLLAGKKAISQGQLITGTIPSKGAQTYTPGITALLIEAGQYLSGRQTIAGVAVPVANVLVGTTIAGQAGTMVNRGAVNYTITTQGGSFVIPKDYHNGSGKVIATFANLIAGNVKSNITIGGVKGTYDGEIKHMHTVVTKNLRGTQQLSLSCPFVPGLVVVSTGRKGASDAQKNILVISNANDPIYGSFLPGAKASSMSGPSTWGITFSGSTVTYFMNSNEEYDYIDVECTFHIFG